MDKKQNSSLLNDPILQKARKWCALQERCVLETEQRLLNWGMAEDVLPEAIQKLTEEGFIDESRFARLFASGKFHVLKWGRIKIEAELRQRKISRDCIRQGLNEIDEEEYKRTLSKLLNQKINSLNKSTPREARQKALKYILSKGYEADLALNILKETDSNTIYTQ